MPVILALLLSCADTVFLVNTEYCEDWEPGSDPELEVQATSLGFDVTRIGVERACDSIFTADIEIDGRTILIQEGWDEGADETCQVCYAPMISVEDPPGGVLTVQWYDEPGQTNPVHTAEYDPDA